MTAMMKHFAMITGDAFCDDTASTKHGRHIEISSWAEPVVGQAQQIRFLPISCFLSVT